MSLTSGVDRELRGRVTVSGSVALARCQERDVGVSAGFILSTRSKPDGGWWEEQGPGGPGTAEPHQPGWTGSSYLDGDEVPCPLPSPESFIRPLATQAGARALCSARPASRTRLRAGFFWTELGEPEARQCCPQNTVVSCHPKGVLQGPCS